MFLEFFISLFCHCGIFFILFLSSLFVPKIPNTSSISLPQEAFCDIPLDIETIAEKSSAPPAKPKIVTNNDNHDNAKNIAEEISPEEYLKKEETSEHNILEQNTKDSEEKEKEIKIKEEEIKEKEAEEKLKEEIKEKEAAEEKLKEEIKEKEAAEEKLKEEIKAKEKEAEEKLKEEMKEKEAEEKLKEEMKEKEEKKKQLQEKKIKDQKEKEKKKKKQKEILSHLKKKHQKDRQTKILNLLNKNKNKNSEDGGETPITDPNSNSSYSAGNIGPLALSIADRVKRILEEIIRLPVDIGHFQITISLIMNTNGTIKSYRIIEEASFKNHPMYQRGLQCVHQSLEPFKQKALPFPLEHYDHWKTATLTIHN